jgi:hypothetical protein
MMAMPKRFIRFASSRSVNETKTGRETAYPLQNIPETHSASVLLSAHFDVSGGNNASKENVPICARI